MATRASGPTVLAHVRPSLLRRTGRWVRRTMDASEARVVVLLGMLTFLLVVAVGLLPGTFPVSAVVVPIVIANLVLGPRSLPWFIVYTLLAQAVAVATIDTIDSRKALGVVVNFLIGLVILLASFRRSRLGVAGLQGESMLVDLRDRIQSSARLPALRAGWHAEAAMRTAGGTPFAGDFIVARGSDDGTELEVVVVDVSGKGAKAGTRALQMSGALGGLLGALPPNRLLEAANSYLVRQDWHDGFATAVYLHADLTDGLVEIRSAGHPPPLQLRAGSGRWEVHDTSGPLLGVLDDVEFPVTRTHLGHGDALLLYTDGLVEARGSDIALGIDRLRGRCEALLTGGLDGGAERLIGALGSTSDDRALVLVRRT